ncbi:MAG: cation:proton antiporter [Deltaproteobacteria bacterium]|nr:cation:proton antiporter [Deltaproteobacteria bacterium]MDZ4346363.1 cation:proton antiporter [Candidatus Binatia bacterium]
METDFLKQLLIVLSATIAIVFLCQKLRLPTIVGFLLAGLVIGPNGVALIEGFAHVEILAEIGVALLLFTIGIEFSLAALVSVQRRVIWAGLLQVVVTVIVVTSLARALGAPMPQAIFFGFLIALSSTAIVLRIYQERGEIHSIHGRAVSGVLFLQDLSIVPMMLLVPVLGRSETASLWDVLWASLQAVVVLLVIVIVARKLLPRLLHHVAVLKNREIFILVVLWICLGTAWLTAQTGLSLALGALVAGLVISESELSHQIVADVLPLRDCFSGIFFISIGMLLDVEVLRQDFLPAIMQFLSILILKGGIAIVTFWALFGSISLAIILGFSLAQVGEFSFILAKSGVRHDLLTGKDEQMFLAVSILSMIATPWLIRIGHYFARGPQRRGTPVQEGAADDDAQAVMSPGRGHVIVVGYGVNGRNLARVLKEVGVPHRILELDPDLVRSATAAGETISFGDAARPEILRQAGIDSARVLVIAISDPSATVRIVAQARRLGPDLYIVVRTRYVAEIEHLYRLGADEVIPEEFETSIEIFARVLDRYHIPRNLISLQVEMIRQGHYGMLRGLRFQGKQLDELNRFLVGITADIYMILDRSPAVGKILDEIDLQNRSGATVIAAVRDGKFYYSFDADFRLRAGDMLVLLGSHKALDDAGQILKPASENGAQSKS